MNRCDEIRAPLDDWLDGLCPSDLQCAIDDHLAHCEACSEQFGQHRRLHEDLRSLGIAADRIASARPGRISGRRVKWLRAGRIAAAIALATAAAWLARAVVHSRPPTPPQIVKAILNERPSETARPPVQIAMLDDDRRMSVSVPSSNSKIHIVWLYETHDPAPERASSSAPAAEN